MELHDDCLTTDYLQWQFISMIGPPVVLVPLQWKLAQENQMQVPFSDHSQLNLKHKLNSTILTIVTIDNKFKLAWRPLFGQLCQNGQN